MSNEERQGRGKEEEGLTMTMTNVLLHQILKKMETSNPRDTQTPTRQTRTTMATYFNVIPQILKPSRNFQWRPYNQATRRSGILGIHG